MQIELFWLGMTVLLTAVMWVPYILNAMVVWGIPGAMGYPEDPPPLAEWAQRAKKAHANAVENLVLFAPAVLMYMHVAEGSGATSIDWAVMSYFYARLAHYLLYIFKIPYLRTLAFLGGWAMTVIIVVKAIMLAQAAV